MTRDGFLNSSLKVPTSPAEPRTRVVAPTGILCLTPEVVSVDVPMSEVHGPLMRLIMIFARDIGHREAARHHRSLGASQEKQIWLGGRRSKVVAGERPARDGDIDAIRFAPDVDSLPAG